MVLKEVNLETIIDADGHIFEDEQAIATHFPKAYQDWGLRGRGIFPPLDHLHAAHAAKSPPGSFPRDVGPEGWKEFLGAAGITSTILYPTSALSYGKIADIDFAIATCQAYNDWLYNTYMTNDTCFKGMALVPIQEPEAAIAELRRAVLTLGMCGAMLPSVSVKGHLGSPEYWPLYAEAERLGCCIAIHGGCHSGFGFDDMNVYPAVHGLGHPFGQMISFSGILLNGIFDRYPNIRIGFLEGGVAWVLLCMERLHESYETHIPFDPRKRHLQLRSGESVYEYIIRQMKEGRIYVGCEGGEPALPYAVSACGSEAFMYSSDFPHEVNRQTVRHEIEELLECDSMTAEDKAAILHGNAERFYRLRPAR